MDILSVFYVISGLYYSASTTFIYCSFLTPKDTIRHPRTAAFFTMSVICICSLINYQFISYELLALMIITLVLFKDSFSRRIAGLIIAYMTQLTTELAAINIYNLLHFLFFKKFPTSRTNSSSDILELLGTVALICASLEKQLALVQEQLAYSQQMEEEYRKLRKWNHDIANHIIALSYLLDNEKYQEGAAYLETLLDISKTGATTQNSIETLTADTLNNIQKTDKNCLS